MLTDLKKALYVLLKATHPVDMTEQEFELFVLLEGEFEVRVERGNRSPSSSSRAASASWPTR